MNRSFEIANGIKQAEASIATLQLALNEIEANIADHIVTVTPRDGWPGSNDINRKLASNRELQVDSRLLALLKDKADIELTLAEARAALAGFRAEAEAINTFIRNQLVIALGGADVYTVMAEQAAQAALAAATGTDTEAESDLEEEHSFDEPMDDAPDAEALRLTCAWNKANELDADPTEEAAAQVAGWAKGEMRDAA
jgi:hypothetical protein